MNAQQLSALHSDTDRAKAFEWLRQLATTPGAPSEAGIAFDTWAALATQSEAAEVLRELVAADAWVEDAQMLRDEDRKHANTRWEAAWSRATALAAKGE